MNSANTQASKIRATWSKGTTSIKLLIQHEMESGQRKDVAGKIISAWFVKTVQITCVSNKVATFYFGPAVSKNPFIAIEFDGGKVGDSIEVSWIDNLGNQRNDTATIMPA